jgi:signal transduction histidine kinase/ligand-binding sensor domain-containing protein/DNA-binding response OmpR family regulator
MKPLTLYSIPRLHWSNAFALVFLFPVLLSAQDKNLSRQTLFEKAYSGGTSTIHEDNFGFIWHGRNGLYRYDGKHSKEYRVQTGDSSSQRIADVFDIIEEKNGNLLVATRKGLYHYDRKTNEIRPRYHQMLQQHFGVTPPLYSICKDTKDRLWIGSQDTLFIIDQQHKNPVQTIGVFDLSYQAGSENLRVIYEAADGLIYIGTKKGLLRIDKNFEHRYFVPEEYVGREEQFILQTIQQGNRDTLWLGGTDGVWIFETKKQTFTALEKEDLKGKFVRKIFKDQQENLWISTKNRLLLRHPTGDFRVINNGSQMALRWVRAILQDRFGNIWTAGNKGVTLLKVPFDEMFPFYRINGNLAEQDNYFFRVMQDSSGGFWFRMFDSDLGYSPGLDQAFKIALQPPQNTAMEEIKEFCTDSDGNVWVLTLTNGIFLFEKGQPSPQSVQLNDTLSSTMSRCIIADRHNKRLLWFASTSGLCSVDRFTYEMKWYFPKNDLPWLEFNGTRQIHQASDGTIWCVLHYNDHVILGYLDPKSGKFHAQQQNPGLPDLKKIYQLRRGPEQTMLAPTNKGLVIIDERTKTQSLLGPENGLPMQKVLSVMPDREGNLWMTSGKTLCKYDGHEFQPFRVDQVGSFAHTSSTMTQNGLLAFGGTKGLLVFDPSKPKLDSLVPKVYLSNFKVSNKSKRLETAPELIRNIQLPFREKVFTIEFLTPHFGRGPIRYKYMLEGFDQEWTESGTEPQATYTNLSPGNYQFKVMASAWNGHWPPEDQSLLLDLKILPPWYRTWLAWLFWIAIPLAIILAIYRIQLHRQLAQAEALRLKELAEVKSHLFTNITHEFRTPLTVIQGMVDQIRTKPESWMAEGLGLIERNSKQLLDLVNQLLSLSRLEARQMPLHLIQGDIISFLRYQTESFHSLAETKDIRLHFLSNLVELVMDYDPEKLQIVMSNLLSNAIKFTPAEGNVYVRVEEAILPSAHYLQFTVQDTGVGITPEHLPHIFKRFYQVDASSTRAGEGTGIGLALVKELIDAMNGQIEVSSRQGTQFELQLPITRHASSVSVSQPTISANHLAESLVLKSEQANPIQALTKDDRSLILLIEDNADVLRYLTSFLSGDYEIKTARNGKEGIQKALEIIPDLIVSDVMMPEQDGIEVCQRLKTDERTNHIPIILLTAKTDTDSKIRGLTKGADAYLAKPFSREELMVRIEKLIALRRILQERFQQNGTVNKFLEKTPTTVEEVFMQKVLKVIEENYQNEDFGMPQLCEQMHMSRSNLFRKIKALTGKPTTHLIRSIRLKKAEVLLRTTTLNVSEICFRVGISHPTYFTTLFRKEYGASPTEYRTKHQ